MKAASLPRLMRKPRRLHLQTALVILFLLCLLFVSSVNECNHDLQWLFRSVSSKLGGSCSVDSSFSTPTSDETKTSSFLQPNPDGSGLTLLPHLWAEGMVQSPRVCDLHSRPLRSNLEKTKYVRLIEVISLDDEADLDMLELRMAETWSAVDKFFVVETNMTLDGRGRELRMGEGERKGRFGEFRRKLEYRFVPEYPDPTKSPAVVQRERTAAMDRLMRSHLHELRPELKVLVHTSHVAQIPARHTLAMLKACIFPNAMHLQYRSYMYSFEYYLGIDLSRSSIRTYTGGGRLLPVNSTEEMMLGDAGWHCQYCFRRLRTYVSSLRTHWIASGLESGEDDKEREGEIQDALCKGNDMFGVGSGGVLRHTSAVYIPKAVLDKKDELRYLIPGNCVRERERTEPGKTVIVQDQDETKESES